MYRGSGSPALVAVSPCVFNTADGRRPPDPVRRARPPYRRGGARGRIGGTGFPYTTAPLRSSPDHPPAPRRPGRGGAVAGASDHRCRRRHGRGCARRERPERRHRGPGAHIAPRVGRRSRARLRRSGVGRGLSSGPAGPVGWLPLRTRPGGVIGRRRRLKPAGPSGREGSSPSPGTGSEQVIRLLGGIGCRLRSGKC